MTEPNKTYGRYERWLSARSLHVVSVTEAEPINWKFGLFVALAEKENSPNYGYGHGYTPRQAVAELCRTVRAHERAKRSNPTVWMTSRG